VCSAGSRRSDGDSQLSTWIYRLTVNASLSHLARRRSAARSRRRDARRRAGAHKRSRAIPGLASRIEPRSSSCHPATARSSCSTMSRVWSHEECASILECRVGTCKSQLHKARARMRDLLGPMGDGNEWRPLRGCSSAADPRISTASSRAIAQRDPRPPARLCERVATSRATRGHAPRRSTRVADARSSASLWAGVQRQLAAAEVAECEDAVVAPRARAMGADGAALRARGRVRSSRRRSACSRGATTICRGSGVAHAPIAPPAPSTDPAAVSVSRQ